MPVCAILTKMNLNRSDNSLVSKKTVSFFVFIFCLIIVPVTLFGQNIANLNIEKVQDEGLTDNYITNIAQDKNGFIWVGTGEGVFRYDGYTFKAFRNFPGDSTTLANNLVTALYAENDNLWVGTVNDLSCININTLVVKNFPSGKRLQIDDMLPKND